MHAVVNQFQSAYNGCIHTHTQSVSIYIYDLDHIEPNTSYHLAVLRMLLTIFLCHTHAAITEKTCEVLYLALKRFNLKGGG